MQHRILASLVAALVLGGCGPAKDSTTTESHEAVTQTTLTVTGEVPTTLPSTTVPVTTIPDEAPEDVLILPTFAAEIREIDAATKSRMAASWREGCPVPIADLRLVIVNHWDFDGGVGTGELVVHADVAQDIVSVFEILFQAGYPIEQVVLVDEFGGDDLESMRANNTSAFNCRTVAGTDKWSEHAYGKAIDVNPLVNPYVRGNQVLPSEGAAYLDRGLDTPGLIRSGDPVVEAFGSVGWSWGGAWRTSKDYQHFSLSGS